MMKLGIICSQPTKENAAYVKSLGLSCVEICNNNNEETLRTHENMADYIVNVREAGLFFSSVGRWNSNMNTAGHVNEEEFSIVSKTLEDAITAGAPTFVCGCNYDDSVSLYKNYTAAIEIFGRLADKARGTGTSVAIYNCDWNNFVNNMEAWKIVLGELPDVMIKYDASHSYHAGRDYMHEIADWGDRFAHVHVKGAVVNRGRYVADPPAGLDDLKWGSIFAALYSNNYDGCLSIEPHSAAWMPDSERGKAGIRYTIDYISRLMM